MSKPASTAKVPQQGSPAGDGKAQAGMGRVSRVSKSRATGGGHDAPLIATQSRHLVIRASAGSGKTYQLAVRYLRHLLDGAAPDQILASTFTRKAAGEILARILTRLAKAGQSDKELHQLAAHLGVPSLSRRRCLTLLKELSRSLNRLRIGTLDSFFARLATSYTLELGLPPGWEIIDELADARLRRQAVEAVLGDLPTSDVRRLTALLSKADSGRRVSTLLQETVDQFYDIFQQTDEAAWHYRPRMKMLTDEECNATLEALRQIELPDLKSFRQALEKDCEAASSADWQTFISKGIAGKLAAGETKYGRREIPPAAREVYQRLLDHARSCLLQQLLSRTAAVYEILSAFDKVYVELKQRERGLRFEDVTRRLAEAFGTGGHPDQALQQLAYRLDSDVTHLLLDEFQDTSRSQWQVMRPFAEKITQAAEGTSLFAVGDVKQAIYGWRGGVAEIFDAIDGELEGVTSETLATSFRSSQVVIDAVNELFNKLPGHPNLGQDEQTIRQWCKNVEPHMTARDLAGHVTLETSAEPEEQKAAERAVAVIAAAADRVQQIAAEAPSASVGVLVRQNKHIAPLIAELRDRNVEASEESGNPLTDSAAVMLLLSLLQMADHPGDTIARFHIATSPLGAQFDFVDHTDDARAVELAAQFRRQLLAEGYGPTLDDWARRLIACCSRRDVTRLGQLVELAYRFGEQATLRPGDFIRFVEQERVQDPSAARVRVMSVHQAKGLQFDVVVLLLLDHSLISMVPQFVTGGGTTTSPPDLVSVYACKEEQCLLPARFQAAFDQTRAASIREELCVLYVAVTRAVHALHMIIPPSSPTEKGPLCNTAGLVRAALTDGQPAPPSSILYEHGDRAWATAATTAGTGRTATAPVAAGPTDDPAGPKVKLAPMADGRSRGMNRVAPSRSGPPASLRLSQLVEGSSSAALDRGSLIHAWFEQIVWLDDGPPDEQTLRHIARRHGFDDEQTVQHLRSFHDMLGRPAVAALLSQQSYTALQQPPLPRPVLDQLAAGPLSIDVSREQPVAVQLQGELLTGTIDRLVLLRCGGQVIAADIIDYKTDAVPRGDAEEPERTSHYRLQLQSYADAIARIHRLADDRITSRLLFVQSGQVISV
jgi:ATP-dependent helicase/nuclease subunit A